MFGTLGGSELFLILVIALIVFGPRKLPDIGKSIGKMMVEFRKASNDFKQTIENEVEAEKIKAAVSLPMDVTTRTIDPPSAPAIDPSMPPALVAADVPAPEPALAPPSGTVPVDPYAAAADSVPPAAPSAPATPGEHQ